MWKGSLGLRVCKAKHMQVFNNATLSWQGSEKQGTICTLDHACRRPASFRLRRAEQPRSAPSAHIRQVWVHLLWLLES